MRVNNVWDDWDATKIRFNAGNEPIITQLSYNSCPNNLALTYADVQIVAKKLEYRVEPGVWSDKVAADLLTNYDDTTNG